MFDVPDAPKLYTADLSNFLGVDFTSIAPISNRASNMINLVNNDGFLETRPGYDELFSFGVQATLTVPVGSETIKFTAIRKGKGGNDITITFLNPGKPNKKFSVEEQDKNVIYHLATNSSSEVITTCADICNAVNYYVTAVATSNDTVVTALDSTHLTGGVSHRINGIWNYDENHVDYFIVHVENKLYKMDKNFQNATLLSSVSNLTDDLSEGILLSNKLTIFDGKKAIVYGSFDGEFKAIYLDGNGTIPTTSVNRKPDGTGASSEYYESPNLMQPLRINSFVTDGESTVYYLESPFDTSVPPTALIINPDTGLKQNLPITSYDGTKGTVTFATAPGKFPVTGRDSLFITFKPVDSIFSDDYSPDLINKCKICTSYGYNGNNNRIFVTGNPDYPNVDWFSQYEDPMYYPADNFTRIGTEPIMAYSRLNDGSLAVQKKTTDTDFTFYYRTSALYGGQEIFPVGTGVKSLGCITHRCNANLINDPLTLTEQGVFGIKGSSYGERFEVERSYFVKNKLLKEPNLENAVAIVFDNKYYLAINNHVYVADGRYASKLNQTRGSDYQYEWYYWENVPVRGWFTFNDELYFYTDSGDICKFNDTCLDYNIPENVLFDTAFLDLGTIAYAKTVKRVTVITRPYEDSSYTLSYATIDGDENIISRDTSQGEFLSTLQEKEKIKKIMFVKFRLTNNNDKKMNFYRIGLVYILAGRYRSE